MSDITDFSDATASSSSEDNFSVGSEEDQANVGQVPAGFEPYQDEPLASSSDENQDGDDEEEDIDGIPLETLEARFENRQPVDEW